MLMYETERMRVRHLRDDDLDAFAALCADPVAMGSMGDGEILDRETVVRWLDICKNNYATKGYGTSAIADKTTDAFIGFCGIIRAPENDFDEIIYELSQPYWGKGCATEAARPMIDYGFEQCGLNAIYATIDSENHASLAIVRKLGMHYLKTEHEEDGIVQHFVIYKADWLPKTQPSSP